MATGSVEASAHLDPAPVPAPAKSSTTPSHREVQKMLFGHWADRVGTARLSQIRRQAQDDAGTGQEGFYVFLDRLEQAAAQGP